MTLTFSAEQLEALLGITIDQAEWDEPVRSEIEAKIADCEENIRFLRHHTWAELRLRPEFVLQDPQGSLTFDQLIHEKVASPLIEELVRRGFITSHFALYTSTYYGTHLGPDALEYVRRCIEPGEPDTRSGSTPGRPSSPGTGTTSGLCASSTTSPASWMPRKPQRFGTSPRWS